MKRTIALICAFLCILFIGADISTANAADNIPQISVSAESAILIEAKTGRILWEKNSEQKRPMASTTKIMTTLLTLESGDLYEEFTVDSDAITVEGSSMGLTYGDIVTKYALCCGMLLPSGNDAANASAVQVGGSFENFALMMNERAKKLGMNNTNFVTPSGLHDENHYSTAHDMAILCMEAMKNSDFREICSKKSISLNFGNPPYARTLYNTNKLLDKYQYCIGVKTGFTDEAGRCLVSCAQKDGVELICVTLNAPDDWNDHIKLYEYGFSKTILTKLNPPTAFACVVGSGTESVRLVPKETVSIGAYCGDTSNITSIVRTPPFVYAPIAENQTIGVVEYYYGSHLIASTELCAAQSAASD